MEHTMYASIARFNAAEGLPFDPSLLNFDYNRRNVDDYDTFPVEKCMVVWFADYHRTDPVEMFDRLYTSAHSIGIASRLYDDFTEWCLEVA